MVCMLEFSSEGGAALQHLCPSSKHLRHNIIISFRLDMGTPGMNLPALSYTTVKNGWKFTWSVMKLIKKGVLSEVEVRLLVADRAGQAVDQCGLSARQGCN